MTTRVALFFESLRMSKAFKREHEKKKLRSGMMTTEGKKWFELKTLNFALVWFFCAFFVFFCVCVILKQQNDRKRNEGRKREKIDPN